MASDSDNEKNFFGRPRRSSFVPATPENDDFVPVLPAVGSTPLPAASDVNYFPTVATGQPSLREPEPPARLVVPTRRSMTEEEIAGAFAESQEMSSAEQIALLDSQMTLREDDLRTARSFFATLRTANPREADPLLQELKVRFADVDPEIADFVLDDLPGSAPVQSDDVAPDESIAPVALVDDAPSAVVAEPTAPPSDGEDEQTESTEVKVNGRYRGWAAVLALSTMIAALVPISASVFTAFGSPAPELVESLLGLSGVVVLLVAIATTVPLVLLARSTAVRHGLSWTAAFRRVLGPWSGVVQVSVLALFALVGLFSVLLATTEGVGIQLASIPALASTLATAAPDAHLTVLVVAALVTLGFAVAAMPRRLFRGTVLLLTGFIAVGPTVVILTNLAVVANLDGGVLGSPEILLLATGVIPSAILMLAAAETGAATVVRRDANRLHGLWLYIGLVLGTGFAAWVLLAGMVDDSQGSVFVGSNPVLHLVAPGNDLAFLFGVVVFAVPVLFLAALVGRTLSMVTVRGDSDAPRVWVRLLVVLIPLTVFVLDALGVLADLGDVLPGAAFLSIPAMSVIGLMAGASIASRRGLSRGAMIVNTVFVSLLTLVGLTLTLWAVPGLEAVYNESIAPIAAAVGLSGGTAVVVPSAIVLISFVLSLVVSAIGARRPVLTD
jgi:hypothetical protein